MGVSPIKDSTCTHGGKIILLRIAVLAQYPPMFLTSLKLRPILGRMPILGVAMRTLILSPPLLNNKLKIGTIPKEMGITVR